jgi:hypothetical protein
MISLKVTMQIGPFTSAALLGCALLIAPAAPAAEEVVGGPFVVNVTTRSAQVVWIVKSGEASLTTAGANPKTAPVLRSESVTFNGLRTGTEYEYSVPGQENLKGKFKTPPAAGEPFEFVVYGDTRSRHDVHRKVIEPRSDRAYRRPGRKWDGFVVVAHLLRYRGQTAGENGILPVARQP